MRSVGWNKRIVLGALAAMTFVIMGATAAWAIESEGEMFVRDRLVGNLGIAHADIGVYPDRANANPAPEVTAGSDVVVIPDGATVSMRSSTGLAGDLAGQMIRSSSMG